MSQKNDSLVKSSRHPPPLPPPTPLALHFPFATAPLFCGFTTHALASCTSPQSRSFTFASLCERDGMVIVIIEQKKREETWPC